MQDTLSRLGLVAAGYASLHGYTQWGNSATSVEAKTARSVARKIVSSSERSQVLFGQTANAISELLELAAECARDDWDDEGSLAVSATAIGNAISFLRALPKDIPIPEFSVEPDGNLSLDWIDSKSRLLSLSVGESNRLAFAWLDGSDKGHSVVRFDGVQIPPRLISAITDIVGNASPSFRAA